MRWVLLSAAGALVLMCAQARAGTPGSYTFGGFSEDGGEYLKRGPDLLVCEARPGGACRPVDKPEARRFTRPPRGRKAGGVALSVAVKDETRIELRAGDREVASHAPGGRISGVNSNLFIAPGEDRVAVEYEVRDGGVKRGDVIVFELTAAAAAPAPPRAPGDPATGPRPAAPPGAGGPTAFDRATGKGGVWEQRILPCDQAGVTLKLSRKRSFDIRITTKCQGQKDVTDLAGTWVSEGTDTIVLSFENEEGPTETMACRFSACEDVPEDCLTCAQDDVSFTMQIVRR